MIRGTIKTIVRDRGFGFIKQADGGEDVFFRLDWVKNAPATGISEGMAVEYEVERAAQGLRAKSVRAVGDSLSQSNTTKTIGYRFLNPYNFVRYLDKPRPKGHLLGNCPPPPHDRYTGLAGKITCHITTVTPLFVSDAHDIESDENHPGHKSYEFFRLLNEQNVLAPALPATSIRGVLRLVFEAVTNSCFSVFEKDEERNKQDRIEHRVSRDPGLTPARVIDVGQHGATLELFDCTTMSPPIRCTDQPTTVKSGMVSAYQPVVLKRQRSGDHIPFSNYGVVTPAFQDGARVAALVGTTRIKHRSNRFQWFPVLKMVPAAKHSTLDAGPGQRKVFGFVHKTGPNIENKHDERLFFRWDDQDFDPQKTYMPTLLKVDERVVEEHDRILRKYWDRHSEEVTELQDAGWPETASDLPHPSVFVREGRKLQENDLVYYFKDSRGIEHLCPVSMPRVPYHYPREQLLPKHLHRCTNMDALCPACRTFGWVHEDAAKMSAEVKVACAGRVRITNGVMTKSNGTLDEPNGSGIPLAILSSPKPTATAFYLLAPGGKPGEADYDQERAKLRGRKFYRHHGEWAKLTFEQRNEHRRAGDQLDKQNRTVKGVLNPGAEFEFQVYFENLQPVELGALLWTLQLEPNMHHRLGFGKPLGFGSLQINTTLQVSMMGARYQVLSQPPPLTVDTKELVGDYVSEFKKAMERVYAVKNEEFDVLPNVMDLKALLSKPEMSGTVHVHYPRHERTASAEGENFKWFVGNRKRLDNSRRPPDKRKLPAGSEPQWLAIASEDNPGLELIDDGGNRVKE